MTDPRSSTVDQIVHRSAARTPDRVALTYADRSWTYAELDAAVSRAAAHLLSLGLSHGDRVATVGANSDAYLLAFLGCSRAGLVHVPVNYALTGRELAYVLAQSGSKVALVDPALRAGVEAVRDQTSVEQVLTLHGDDDAVLPTWSAGDVPEVDARTRDTDLVAAALHLGHHREPQGRDDDAPRAGPRVRLLRDRARPHRGRPAAALHAALPLRPDARVPAAVADGGRDQRAAHPA